MIGTCFDRGGYLYCNQPEARRGGRGDAKINGLGEEERDKERVRRRCSLFFFSNSNSDLCPQLWSQFPNRLRGAKSRWGVAPQSAVVVASFPSWRPLALDGNPLFYDCIHASTHPPSHLRLPSPNVSFLEYVALAASRYSTIAAYDRGDQFRSIS